jgi:hypothetical protein
MFQFVRNEQFMVFVLLVIGSMERKNYVTVGLFFFCTSCCSCTWTKFDYVCFLYKLLVICMNIL